MRLVKLTGTDDKVRHVNPDHIEMLWPMNEETTVLAFNGSDVTFVVQGTPAEVARLLAGEGGAGVDRDEYTEELAKVNAGLTTENAALTAEVERLRAAADETRSLWINKAAALKAERDEARAEVATIYHAAGMDRNVVNIETLAAIVASIRTTAPEPEDEQPEPDNAFSPIRLIADERQRQVDAKGWTLAHDDEHDTGELANAAACYAMHPTHALRWVYREDGEGFAPPEFWPWDAHWWKPEQDRIRELTKAGALIVAEMERLHRAGEPEPDEPGTDGETSRDDPAPTDEPAGEAGDEGAGESGQTPGQPDVVEDVSPPADGEIGPEPAPATPTTALLSYAPRSTSGIGISFAGSVLPLTRTSEGEFLPGCSYVLYTDETATFSFMRDARATDGMAKGTIRWRVNNGGDPFGDDFGSWAGTVMLRRDTVANPVAPWGAANAPISIADLGDPLIDADGSKWWRVEAWSDESATANKSEASTRATVFFVCVLAPGVEAPRPPAIGYHASDPIVIGSPVVHPIVFTTDADPSPGEGEDPSPLLSWEAMDNADPTLKSLTLVLHRDNFQSKRGGTYFTDRAAGHHLDLRPSSKSQPQYSALCTAVRLLTGEATDDDKAFLRLYALNNGLSAPEIAIGEHGDTTALWGGFSYDAAFEETFSVACVYSWGRRFNLWTSSEEARIRDQLARFVWVSLQLHRNPYRKWIHANGSTKAMWESARDQVSGLVALVMRSYRSPQYGQAVGMGIEGWDDVFIDGGNWSEFGLNSRSGLYGLLSDEPRWNADPRYFTSHNCAGPLALTLVCLANAGETVPSYYEDAFILALDGKLPGAEGVHFWSPLMVHDAFPKLRKAIIDRFGKAAVLAAAREISLGDPNDPAKPGGMGAGTAVLSLLSIDFGGA